MRMSWRGSLYRLVMRVAHRYNWHYAPPIHPEGDTQLWCKWCGFRQTIQRRDEWRQGKLYILDPAHPPLKPRNETIKFRRPLNWPHPPDPD